MRAASVTTIGAPRTLPLQFVKPSMTHTLTLAHSVSHTPLYALKSTATSAANCATFLLSVLLSVCPLAPDEWQWRHHGVQAKEKLVC